MLREHADAVEADLARFYQIDYRDRWRFDADGRRRLTLRRIGVLVRHLPVDSSTAMATGSPGWTLTERLLADVFHATAGEPHPGLPESATQVDPSRAKAIRAAKARAAERKRAIEAGEIT